MKLTREHRFPRMGERDCVPNEQYLCDQCLTCFSRAEAKEPCLDGRQSVHYWRAKPPTVWEALVHAVNPENRVKTQRMAKCANYMIIFRDEPMVVRACVHTGGVKTPQLTFETVGPGPCNDITGKEAEWTACRPLNLLGEAVKWEPGMYP